MTRMAVLTTSGGTDNIELSLSSANSDKVFDKGLDKDFDKDLTKGG